MKKYLFIIVIFIYILFLNGCHKKKEKISFSEDSYVLFVEETLTVTLNIDKRYQNKILIYHSDNHNIARFENGKIIAVSSGYVRIKVSFKDDPNIYCEAIVRVKNRIYEIEYEVDEDIVNKNPTLYSKDTLPIQLTEPVRVGYRFLGWYQTPDFSGEKISIIDTDIHGHLKLYPKWELIESEIIYFLLGGVNHQDNPHKYTYISNFPLLNPTKEGYKFLGWYKNRRHKIENIGPNMIEFLQLYARWELEEYKIIYYLDGGENDTNNPQSYNILDEDLPLLSPSKKGFTFHGWYQAPDFNGEKVEMIPSGSHGEINLYAHFEPIHYQITYYYEGDINDNPTFYTVTMDIILNVPEKKGYRFLGWFDNPEYTGTPITEISGQYGDIILYGKWEIEKYQIIYDTMGGENHPRNPTYYTIDDEYELFAPEREGYTFSGWYLSPDYAGGKISEISYGSTGILYLFALWDINVYTITYYLYGGINNIENPSTFTIESILYLQPPSKKGYLFKGWFLDEKFQYQYQNSIILKDISLYALWEEITYTIEYHLNGGYWQYLNKEQLLNNFLIDFYQFICPYEDLFTFIHGDQGNYQGLWYHKYRYHLYKAEKITIDPTQPYFLNQSEYYYKWILFFDFIETLMQIQNPDENLSLNQDLGLLRIYQYATNQYFNEELLQSIPDYSPKQITFTVESDDIILPRPKKINSLFVGWYLSSDFSGEMITIIPKGTINNISLYAKWKEVQ